LYHHETIRFNLLHNKSQIELPMFSVAPMGSSSCRIKEL
jgi:hypothetical protein